MGPVGRDTPVAVVLGELQQRGDRPQHGEPGHHRQGGSAVLRCAPERQDPGAGDAEQRQRERQQRPPGTPTEDLVHEFVELADLVGGQGSQNDGEAAPTDACPPMIRSCRGAASSGKEGLAPLGGCFNSVEGRHQQ